MRTTNIFGAFLVAIAMVQGVPLRPDMSPSLGHDQASEHPSDLDFVAPRTPIDLNKESGDGSHILLVTRAKSPFKSNLPKIGVPKVGSSKAKSSKAKLSKSKSSKSKSSKSKSSKSKSSKSKSSKYTAGQDSDGLSTGQEKQAGDVGEQGSLDPSTDKTAESSEEDTDQDFEDLSKDDSEGGISGVSDENTDQDSPYLSEDDTEGLTDDDSDDSGIESSGDDPDKTTLDQEMSVTNNSYVGADPDETNVEGTGDTTGEDGSEIDAATNITLKLARTIEDIRKHKRSTLLFREDKEQKNQGKKDSRYAETDIADDTDASHEANRKGDKEQFMGDISEKRRLNVGGLFKPLAKFLAEQGVEEAASLSDDEDANKVALPEMATRRANAN